VLSIVWEIFIFAQPSERDIRCGRGIQVFDLLFVTMSLFRRPPKFMNMKILKTLIRVYTTDLDETLRFYESLTGTKTARRMPMPAIGLELAQVQDILIISGPEESLRPFRQTTATFLVDSLDEYHRFLVAQGAGIISPPKVVPTGMNMTVQHPDGVIIEYVEHKKM
jgi:predicted enzyme related to lactoylglutathione lyase